MDPIPTLDVLLNDPMVGKDRLTLVTQSAIAAATAELAAINELDRLAWPADWLDGRPSVAATLRRQYDAWVAAAEALRQRVAAATVRAGIIKGADDLDAAIGRTRARLSVTLDDLMASVQDGLEGREYQFASVEDMRHELLRPGVPRKGPDAVRTAEPLPAGGRP